MSSLSSRMMSMQGVRPYDQSLALKCIARSNDDAFSIAVLDDKVRNYLISQRSPNFTARRVYTMAWARGFAKHTEEFVTAIHETGESPTDLGVLTGLPPEGLLLADRAVNAARTATRELMAAHVSAATLNDVEVQTFYDVATLRSDADVNRALRKTERPLLDSLLEDYDGDMSHLFVHLAYRRLVGHDIPVSDVLRLNAIGLVDPVTLTRAAAEHWPDEYAHALDAD